MNIKFLSQGDTIDIVAPAKEGVMTDFSVAKKYLRSLKLKLHYSEDIFELDDKNGFYPFSNIDEYRAQDLIPRFVYRRFAVCLVFKKVDMDHFAYQIICRNSFPAESPSKLFIGFSDLTFLHLFLQNKYNMLTLHADTILHHIKKKRKLAKGEESGDIENKKICLEIIRRSIVWKNSQ